MSTIYIYVCEGEACASKDCWHCNKPGIHQLELTPNNPITSSVNANNPNNPSNDPNDPGSVNPHYAAAMSATRRGSTGSVDVYPNNVPG